MGITVTQRKKLKVSLTKSFGFSSKAAANILENLDRVMMRDLIPFTSDISVGYIDEDGAPNNDMDDSSANLAFTTWANGSYRIIGYPHIMDR